MTIICTNCSKDNVVRVYKTPRERIVNLFLPGKAYHCNACGHRMYKHSFPLISWPILVLLIMLIL